MKKVTAGREQLGDFTPLLREEPLLFLISERAGMARSSE